MIYRPPIELRKRKEVDISKDQKPMEANTDATGVELHADSKMYAAFQAFKETDAYNKFVDARMKYEESENPLIRGARFITDKIQDVMGGLGKPSETSEVYKYLFTAKFLARKVDWYGDLRSFYQYT